ncbi:hypothetical protein Tco_0750481 [Tanacetum coccineum]|uniref:Uncharacterized protein n=1 Tax=Tanacetum coccineum TaxID=301880 RepID=A0ABQ4Z1L1_9ASTR
MTDDEKKKRRRSRRWEEKRRKKDDDDVDAKGHNLMRRLIPSTYHHQIQTPSPRIRQLLLSDDLMSTESYRERPYVAPTAPVAHVDRADPDDPSPRPTRRPRHDDPYVMVRDAATKNEGDVCFD